MEKRFIPRGLIESRNYIISEQCNDHIGFLLLFYFNNRSQIVYDDFIFVQARSALAQLSNFSRNILIDILFAEQTSLVICGYFWRNWDRREIPAGLTLSRMTGMCPWNLTERSLARCLRSHLLRDGIMPRPSSSPCGVTLLACHHSSSLAFVTCRISP